MAEMKKDDEKREELKRRARELAGDTGRYVAGSASEAGSRGMSAFGERIDRAADYVEQRRGPESPVGDRLHGAAGWLREHDANDVMDGIDRAVRSHPYRSVAIGLAVGYLFGRLLSR